ncbi:cell division ATP-binding protein FtsE, partial [Salmonella enterica subsp. enterica serovar Heidelberg]
MLRFEHVSKAYLGGRQTVQGRSFQMRPRGMAFLIVHSGVRKSTLVKITGRIDSTTAGNLLISVHVSTRPQT